MARHPYPCGGRYNIIALQPSLLFCFTDIASYYTQALRYLLSVYPIISRKRLKAAPSRHEFSSVQKSTLERLFQSREHLLQDTAHALL